jgi:2-polyprenyl-3-methyl-5-hydroxy-6-metoxy-1,4-benzoquinol methylase
MSSQATRIKQIKKERKEIEKLKTLRTSPAAVENIRSKYPASREINRESKVESISPKNSTKQVKTDWGGVAKWYDGVVNDNDSYQAKVILPNITRVMGDAKLSIKGKKVLDIACGQGYFAEKFSTVGAQVFGFDLGEDLIKIAKTSSDKSKLNIQYTVANAENFTEKIKESNFDIAVCILALQNISDIKKVFEATFAKLKKGGRFVFVINHPAYRNPRSSDWGWDEKEQIRYRRVDAYMSEAKIKMDMNPGESDVHKKKFTYSFHRPLQTYVKTLANSGFVISKIEEWTSHKVSEQGPKSAAENKARHEFPLFMCIEATKL